MYSVERSCHLLEANKQQQENKEQQQRSRSTVSLRRELQHCLTFKVLMQSNTSFGFWLCDLCICPGHQCTALAAVQALWSHQALLWPRDWQSSAMDAGQSLQAWHVKAVQWYSEQL